MRRNPNRNITRFDFGNSHGFWVRFTRGTRGVNQVVYSRFFSDGKHGGLWRAERAARKHRDELERRVPPPDTAMGIGHAWIKRDTIRRRVERAEVWVGWVRLDDGRAASTSRSIETWGRDEARELVLGWIRGKRAEIRKHLGRAAPPRFPAIVYHPPGGSKARRSKRKAERR